MRDFFSGKWPVILLSAILLCLVMSIFAALGGGHVSPISNFINILTTPIEKAVSGISNGIDSVGEHWFNYDRVVEENENLRRELSETKQKLRDAEVAEKENLQLRTALGMKERNRDFVFESAEIIGRSTENWTSTVTIDKGSLSGIAVNNCVITDAGMVGYVSEVGTTWATVTTVIDTGMEASAIVSRTREVASAEGDFELMQNGCLKLSYLESDTLAIKGDAVEISGLGGLFPKGIVLGIIEEIKNETHGISKYAVVRPAADLKKVSSVLVVKSFTITE